MRREKEKEEVVRVRRSYDIYTDGASSGNPGPSGWGAVIIGAGRRVEIGGGALCATNNQMELSAVIEALREVPQGVPVTIHADSSYVIDGITRHIRRWRKNNFYTVDRRPVENRDLWEELDSLSGENVIYAKVAGHSGDPENERANDIAQGFSRHENVKLADEAYTPSESAALPVVPGDLKFPLYVVLEGGELSYYPDWENCERAVHGRSCRFKKCKNAGELQFILAKWGSGGAPYNMERRTG